VDQTPVVWVIPRPEFDLADIPERLAACGYRVLRCLLGASANVDAAVRVLHADLFPDIQQLRKEYESDTKPTLIIAGSREQELPIIEFLSGTGDVAVGPLPLELLVFRLTRLLAHATGLVRLEALRNEDPLTGLLNRTRLLSCLTEAVGAQESGGSRAVVMLDVDHFKRINDSYGHLAGDLVLREFSALLQAGAPAGDRFGRLGGDEFIWLMTRYDQQTAVRDVQELLNRVAGHHFVTPNVARVTASAGMTFVQRQADGADLLRHADQAMYEAKSRGRNQLVIYDQWKASALADDKDVNVEHFKNVTRVLTERVTTAVTRFGESLVEEARREAKHDALTTLHNRRYFDSRMAREVERAVGDGHPLTIALMDLDKFHDINATFGYPSGDRALRQFAEVALGCVRSLDWIARYGGEEFCVVMPDTELEDGVQVAERIRAAVEAAEIWSLDQRPVVLTVSVGVAQWSADLDGVVRLTEKASAALLEAKNAGRNRVIVRR
jgi:two-component system cell cycle response regulator